MAFENHEFWFICGLCLVLNFDNRINQSERRDKKVDDLLLVNRLHSQSQTGVLGSKCMVFKGPKSWYRIKGPTSGLPCISNSFGYDGVALCVHLSPPAKKRVGIFLKLHTPLSLCAQSGAYFFPLFFFLSPAPTDSGYGRMKITCSYTLDVVIVGECREPPNEEERHLLIIFRIRISPKIWISGIN